MDYNKQAEQFLNRYNAKLRIEFDRYDFHLPDDKEKRDIYEVTISRKEKSYTFYFGQSVYNSKKGNGEIKAPSAYDILTSLMKCDPETFENFCNEYVIDNDSVSALKTYKAAANEYHNMRILFNEEELEAMSKIN